MPLMTRAWPDCVQAGRPLTGGLQASRCGPGVLLLLQAPLADSRGHGTALLGLPRRCSLLGGGAVSLHLSAACCRQFWQALAVCGRQVWWGAIVMPCLLGPLLVWRNLILRGCLQGGRGLYAAA